VQQCRQSSQTVPTTVSWNEYLGRGVELATSSGSRICSTARQHQPKSGLSGVPFACPKVAVRNECFAVSLSSTFGLR
jgi:hypothetical protein